MSGEGAAVRSAPAGPDRSGIEDPETEKPAALGPADHPDFPAPSESNESEKEAQQQPPASDDIREQPQQQSFLQLAQEQQPTAPVESQSQSQSELQAQAQSEPQAQEPPQPEARALPIEAPAPQQHPHAPLLDDKPNPQQGISPPKHEGVPPGLLHTTVIEADVAGGDDVDDPGYGGGEEDEGFVTDYASAGSTSLSSSVRDYVFENSRRYHKFKEGRYLVPNDEPEQEREDMKHAMILNLMDGQLHIAPIRHAHRVLDLGTGTGIWAIDMGDEYPEAEITGIDLSPIQPSWVPPNVRFLVDDAEADWTQAPGSLDLVHARHIAMAIKNWPRLIRQAYTALKPGGWIELQEIHYYVRCDDDTLPEDYGYGRFTRYVKEGFARFGYMPLDMIRNPELVREGGFVNVEERVWKVPIGVWPRDQKMKTIGLYNRSMLMDAMQAIGMAPLTRGLRWSREEVELFLIDVRRSLMNTNIHAYFNFHIVIGQKPWSESA